MSELDKSNSKIHPDCFKYHINYKLFHQEKMKWVLHDIQNNPKCQVCCKTIIKYIYSDRGGDLICCSTKCVDEFCYGVTNDYLRDIFQENV